MARGTRHRALDAFLYRLRPRAAAQVLRLLPARQGHGLGQAAEGPLAGAPSRRAVRRPRRKRMADRADEVDQVLSRSQNEVIDDQEAVGECEALLPRHERWADL